MSVYELARLPRITAGVGARERIAALAGAGGAALLVADPGLGATGLIEETVAGLRKGGFAVSLFTAF
jgi:alcohol dehydrogenase class IV